MKKTIMAIILASALALCATACSNDPEDATLGTSDTEAVAEVTEAADEAAEATEAAAE